MEGGGGDRGGRGRRPWREGEETMTEGGGDNGGRRVFNAVHIKTTATD